MLRSFTIFFVLLFLHACTSPTINVKLSAKQVLDFDYGVNSDFLLFKDSLIIYPSAENIYKKGMEDGPYFRAGLYRPNKDSIIVDEKFYNGQTINAQSLRKIIGNAPIVIRNIYSTRFKYDMIADSFNLYPSGGAAADIVLNKPGAHNDTTSYIYKFSKEKNMLALRKYDNYVAYLTYNADTSACISYINIVDSATNEKFQITTDFCPGQLNFLLFDLLGDKKPEIILFYTPVFTFRDVGRLKVYKILD